MAFLVLGFLVALFLGGDNTDGFERPISFQVIVIESFYNHSWVQSLCSGWLDELETLRWEKNSGTIGFLQPWSRGNFSNNELADLERLINFKIAASTQEIQKNVNKLQFEYPFEVQVTKGCELQSEETSVGFVRVAYQGTDLLSLENNSWMPSPQGGSRAQIASRLLNLYKLYTATAQKFISDTCPRFIWGLLEAGKEDLQRQLKPEAWLSSGPSPGPGHLLLVCRVSGFYPKPVLVTWMRGNQEQPGTERSDVLPNADGTWYVRVTVEVTAGEAAGLSCRVQHSSLGDQDIILHWERQNSTGFIVLAVILVLALLAGLVFWLRKLWIHHGPPHNLLHGNENSAAQRHRE
ncbi:T-cell surface glycoprotein CD1a-like [Ochotona curzoniae]|uniref:T-cell surface glycoprotein CD1a-like n=1 Tax=Ochotona curzoniae TaxID=130825 RepID=UPI001B349619|nr:T-cell surface glycoprotein CD1a-like [Ochotona curzoniae]